MLVRTGLLFVPTIDEEASRTLRGLLAQESMGAVVVAENHAGAQRNWIAEILRRWCDEDDLALILTVGGTWPAPGHSDLEPVPDATDDVLERSLPGIADAMRHQAASINRLALMDRGKVGIRGRTLVVNLPWGARSASVFLSAISDLIVPVVERLRAGDMDDEMQSDLLWIEEHEGDPSVIEAGETSEDQAVRSPQKKSHGLDADEFAAFLRRKRDTDPGGR